MGAFHLCDAIEIWQPGKSKRPPHAPAPYFDYSRNMRSRTTIRRLAALAHEHRLAVFRLLVRAGREGRPAGEIAADLDLPPSSLSFHLSALTHAGLVVPIREGRSIRYRIAAAAVRELLVFLTAECCDGRPELCPELRVDRASAAVRKRRRAVAPRRRTSA